TSDNKLTCSCSPKNASVHECENRTDTNNSLVTESVISNKSPPSVETRKSSVETKKSSVETKKSSVETRKSSVELHDSSSCSSVSKSGSLALDRNEPVTVYRDPDLAHKQNIRHIESLQHSLIHPVVPSVPTAAGSKNPAIYSRVS